jgi:kynurenine formamidase
MQRISIPGTRSDLAYHRISHTITLTAPRFPGNPPNQIDLVRSMAKGDSCNVALVTLFNHNGTHVDAPNHYHPDGRRVVDCELREFIFVAPVLLDVPAGEDEAITAEMLQPHAARLRNKDLALLRTGFGARRKEAAYLNNPYLTVDAAEWLKSLGTLRGIGLDFLSPTNPNRRPLGHEVHRILLGQGDAPPIMILEDLDLSAVEMIRRFRRVYAIPLYVDGVDGMPATVFGEYPVQI